MITYAHKESVPAGLVAAAGLELGLLLLFVARRFLLFRSLANLFLGGQNVQQAALENRSVQLCIRLDGVLGHHEENVGVSLDLFCVPGNRQMNL